MNKYLRRECANENVRMRPDIPIRAAKFILSAGVGTGKLYQKSIDHIHAFIGIRPGLQGQMVQLLKMGQADGRTKATKCIISPLRCVHYAVDI